MKTYGPTKEEFEAAVQKNYSIASTLKQLNMRISGSSYRAFHNKVKKWNVDISHFTVAGFKEGHSPKNKRLLTEILVENSDYYSSSNLSKRLVREGLLEYRCSICDLREWLGNPISLELDHINGVRNDNRRGNLRLLCPNCHAQTETYCRGAVRLKARLDNRRVCAEESCSVVITRYSNRCIKHANDADKLNKRQKVVWPPTAELLDRLAIEPYTRVALSLGVTDNALRKHLRVRGVDVPRKHKLNKAS